MSENQGDTKRLLLISNSTLYGGGYLDHAEEELREALGSIKRLLFVPYALHDCDAYAAQARKRFEAMGYGLDSVHEAEDKKNAIDSAEAIFVAAETRLGCYIVFTSLTCYCQYADALRKVCCTSGRARVRSWPRPRSRRLTTCRSWSLSHSTPLD